MTSEIIKNAVIVYLSESLEIPVVDAEQFDTIEMPCVTVKIQSTERISLALVKAETIQLEVTYRAHSGDATRSDVTEQAAEIDNLLSSPSAIKEAINPTIESAHIDRIFFASGSPEWDESTLNQTWTAEVIAQAV